MVALGAAGVGVVCCAAALPQMNSNSVQSTPVRGRVRVADIETPEVDILDGVPD
jgi:hypothetical protein